MKSRKLPIFFVNQDTEGHLCSLILLILDRATEVSFYDIETDNKELSEKIKYYSNLLNQTKRFSINELFKCLDNLISDFSTPLWLQIINVELIKLLLDKEPAVLNFFSQKIMAKDITIDFKAFTEFKASAIPESKIMLERMINSVFGCGTCPKGISS